MLRSFSFLCALVGTLAACQHAPVSHTAAQTETAAHVWLLGEVHDSGAGHAARVEVLRTKISAGWRPAIAMEQFDTGQQPALDAAMRNCQQADCVIQQVTGEKSSWTWPFYAPVIQLALDYQLPLLAANLSRGDASTIVKTGFDAALSAELIAAYQLNALPPHVLQAQETEVRESHCGALPESLVPPMAKAQIARDVVMAETIRAHVSRGVVLIAGNGHVRNDIAVPFWLRQAGINSVAMGFLEPNADARAFDDVRRIPKTERPDPCASFKAPATK